MNRYYAIPMTLLNNNGEIIVNSFPMALDPEMALEVQAPSQSANGQVFSQMQFQIRLVGFERLDQLQWTLSFDQEQMAQAGIKLAKIETNGDFVELPDFQQTGIENIANVESFYLNFAMFSSNAEPLKEQLELSNSGISFMLPNSSAKLKSFGGDNNNVQGGFVHPPRVIITY
ncbi:hypothetical protein [uncultured Ferrimonas sp.]|uniref:hypothetical protein n=1 Tax=uncultured Ferrimonas sp. TaxID=432640 RepID=UPI00260EA150|nr:hypothetical protein [uncultured Ferrimonas sp.]